MKRLIFELEAEKEQLISRIQEEPIKCENTSQTSPSPEPFELVSHGSSETKSNFSNDWAKIQDESKSAFDPNLSIDDEKEKSECHIDRKNSCCEVDAKEINESDAILSDSDIMVLRTMPAKFKNEIFKCCDIDNCEENILSEILGGILLEDVRVDVLSDVLATYLLKIIPNIILNKREVSCGETTIIQGFTASLRM